MLEPVEALQFQLVGVGWSGSLCLEDRLPLPVFLGFRGQWTVGGPTEMASPHRCTSKMVGTGCVANWVLIAQKSHKPSSTRHTKPMFKHFCL